MENLVKYDIGAWADEDEIGIIIIIIMAIRSYISVAISSQFQMFAYDVI